MDLLIVVLWKLNEHIMTAVYIFDCFFECSPGSLASCIRYRYGGD